jgi:hypothetical protein
VKLSLLLVVVVVVGCAYDKARLVKRGGVYTNYPDTVDDEAVRRWKRSRNAMLLAPLEVAGGAAMIAAAFYGGSSPRAEESGSATGVGAAAEDLLGRLAIASVGGTLVLAGIGDLVLGAVDLVQPSPLVRDGLLIPPEYIDSIAPQRTPRFVIEMRNVVGSRGIGPDLGFGLAHWLNGRVRLRHGAIGNLRFWFGDRVAGGVTYEASIERAFGRERAGLYPKRSIGAYAGAGMWWNAEREDPMMPARVQRGPSIVGGLSVKLRGQRYQVGSRYTPGIDRYPSIDVSVGIELGGD